MLRFNAEPWEHNEQPWKWYCFVVKKGLGLLAGLGSQLDPVMRKLGTRLRQQQPESRIHS